jgi:hypothetical protein
VAWQHVNVIGGKIISYQRKGVMAKTGNVIMASAAARHKQRKRKWRSVACQHQRKWQQRQRQKYINNGGESWRNQREERRKQ